MKWRCFKNILACWQKLNCTPLSTRNGTKSFMHWCACSDSVWNKTLLTHSLLMKVPQTQYFLTVTRNYAKGKDKKKEKGKHKVEINERELAEMVPLQKLQTHMQKAVDNLKEEYVKSFSLRTSSGALESLSVQLEGQQRQLGELAQIARPDTRTIVLSLAAFPQALPAVLQALRASGMNLNPQQDGTTLMVPVPRVTSEHRQQLSRGARTQFVRCRDTVKAAAMQQAKALRDRDGLPQDAVFRVQQQLTALADSYVAVAQQLLDAKLQELQPTDKS